MIRGRIETTPSEQLIALRKARDHYMAIADHLKDGSRDTATNPEDRQRERDARRIASAYDKSIANMVAKMVRAGAPTRATSFFNNLGMARPVFAVAVGLVALLAFVYPGRLETRSVKANVSSPTRLQTRPKITPAAPEKTTLANSTKAAAVSTGLTASPAHKPAAEHAHPAAKSLKSIAAHKGSNDEDSGFLVKVLQPDGTLKEVRFSSRAQR